MHEAATRFNIVVPQQVGWRVGVHSSCVCNELQALHNRHLVDRGHHFQAQRWTRAYRNFSKIYLSDIKAQPIKIQEVLAGYSGSKKRMYYRAMKDYFDVGLCGSDRHVKMFIKPDKIPAGKIKDPRAIQYRSPKFNLVFSSFIKPIEHALYSGLVGGASNTRFIAKCLNPVERAELLLRKAAAFDRPRFWLLDHERFDSCVRVEHLKSTHHAYRRIVGRHLALHWCCQAQLLNKGFTKGGIRYRVRGTRMSGDADTALGNSLVNAVVLFAWVEGRKFDMLLDGDDSIVILEDGDVPPFDVFEQLGFTTKIASTLDIRQAEFCQSRLINTVPPRFVRAPMRVLSHSAGTVDNHGMRYWKTWVGSVGMCELVCNKGVPVLQEFGRQLSEVSWRYQYDEHMQQRMGSLPRTRTCQRVTDRARLDFYVAWGIAPDEQRALEALDFTADMMRYTVTKGTARILKYPTTWRSVLPQELREYGSTVSSIWRSGTRFRTLPPCPSECCWTTGEQRLELLHPGPPGPHQTPACRNPLDPPGPPPAHAPTPPPAPGRGATRKAPGQRDGATRARTNDNGPGDYNGRDRHHPPRHGDVRRGRESGHAQRAHLQSAQRQPPADEGDGLDLPAVQDQVRQHRVRNRLIGSDGWVHCLRRGTRPRADRGQAGRHPEAEARPNGAGVEVGHDQPREPDRQLPIHVRGRRDAGRRGVHAVPRPLLRHGGPRLLQGQLRDRAGLPAPLGRGPPAHPP